MHLITDYRFDHTGISEASRHWPYLTDDNRIMQRSRCHFMNQQLDNTTDCNKHVVLSGKYQHRVTYYLSTGNLIVRKTAPDREPTGLGRWKLQIQRTGEYHPLDCFLLLYSTNNPGMIRIYVRTTPHLFF